MKKLHRIFCTLLLMMLFSQINAQNENALHFDGNDQVFLDPNIDPQITSEGTLEAWINTTAFNSGYRGLVVRSTFYGLFLVDNKLSTYIWGGSSPGVVTAGPDLNDGEWHHVAFSFRINVSGGSQLYLDGQPVGPAITLQGGLQPWSFQLGANTNQQFYIGKMDDVKIWSRALSAEELENTVSCGTNGSTGLVASYSFNTGTAGGNNSGLTTLTDNSGLSNDGTLSVGFQLNGATSNWVSGYVCPCSTPTGNAAQTFCEGAQVSDLVADGLNVEWYTNPTGGTALDPSTILTDATDYYAAQGGGGCLSTPRLQVTVTISGPVPPAPTGDSQQFFCLIENSTVAELMANGDNIQWYASEGSSTPLPMSTPIVQQYYYATQTINGCESETYLTVFAFETSPPLPPLFIDPSLSFCSGATISDLNGSATNLMWFDAPTGGLPLSMSTVLINGINYYASSVSLGCESFERTQILVEIVPSIDLTVTIDGILITSNQDNGQYQWIDCNNNNEPMLNETLQSYNAIEAGSYAVIISLPNCSDTTECYSEFASLNENAIDQMLLMAKPNPVNDFLSIYSSRVTQAQITSANGALIETIRLDVESNLDVTKYPSGIYFIKTLEGQTAKFVKR
jgi:hypothetical protein